MILSTVSTGAFSLSNNSLKIFEMSRRQLTFNMVFPSIEEKKSFRMNCPPSNSDVIPQSLSFNDDYLSDSGFESQDSENETSPPPKDGSITRTPFWNQCYGTRKTLFSRNRSRGVDELHLKSKKSKVKEAVQPNLLCETEVTSETMKAAVDKMDVETGLIGDGSQTHRLPTVPGRHKDLKSVSPHTVSQLLKEQYDDVLSGYHIIDCRYPYEYEGGHIKGAVNLHTEAMITDLITRLQNSECTSRNILIFHCEFSSERGPKLLRHLRSIDRKLNSDRYPFLFYPEVYLLDGGYKAFYQQHQVQCEPRNYLPMMHKDYLKQLRHFRVKSKSWTAGQRQRQSMHSRHMMMDASPLKL